MVDMLNILLKIKDFVVIIARFLYRLSYLLLINIWRIILHLVSKIGTKASSKKRDSELIPPESTPEISEDEDVADSITLNSKDNITENTPLLKEQVLTTTEGTEMRKRIVAMPDDEKNCQVCGVGSATFHCKGVRCYKFFCANCNTLYHQHPKRVNHEREDISTYIANSNSPMINNNENSLPNKIKEIIAVIPQASDSKSFDEDVASGVDYQKVDKVDISSFTAWECEFCTFVNDISTKICQICAKTTNTQFGAMVETAKEVLPAENVPKIPTTKPPTTLTKRTKDHKANNNLNKHTDLYKDFWNGKTPNNQPLPHDNPNCKDTQTTPNRPGNNNTQVQNNSMKSKNESLTFTKKTVEDSGEEQLAICQEQEIIPPTENISLTWECSFCTLKNVPSTNICQVCGKSKKHVDNTVSREDLALHQANITTSINADGNDNTDPMAMEFMQTNHIDNYDIAKLASILVKKNFRLQDAIEAAKNCSTLADALAYLEQDCIGCSKKLNKREMIQMLHCTHQACKDCIRRYFTKNIRSGDITSFVCPVCQRPNQQQIETFDDFISEYFANLSELLKPILDAEDIDLYQQKLRDWNLRRDANYITCPNCPNGGIVEENLKWIECTSCNVTSCIRCKKTWYKEHERKTCEEYAAWLENQLKAEQTKKQKVAKKNIQQGNTGLFGYFTGSKKKPDNKQSTSGNNNHNNNGRQETDLVQRGNDSYASVANSTKQTRENTDKHNQTNYQQSNNQFPSLPDSKPPILDQPPKQNAFQELPQSSLNNSHNTARTSKLKSDFLTRDLNNSLTITSGQNNQLNIPSSGVLNDQNNSSFQLQYPTEEWHCKRCTMINSRFKDICLSCNMTYSSNSNSGNDGQFKSSANENIQSNSSASCNNIDNLLNFLDISKPADDFAAFEQGNNSSKAQETIPMDWQPSHGSNSAKDWHQAGNRNEHQHRVALIMEAERHGFSIVELDTALLMCGNGNPIQYLVEKLKRNISYVVLVANSKLSNYNLENKVNIPLVTDIQARFAIQKQHGNCEIAIRECIDENLAKVSSLTQRDATNIANLNTGTSTVQNIQPNQQFASGSLTNERIFSHTEYRTNNTLCDQNPNFGNPRGRDNYNLRERSSSNQNQPD